MSIENERRRLHQEGGVIREDGRIINELIEENERLTKIVDKLIGHEHHHHIKIRPKLSFNILIHNTNFNFMSQVLKLALTSAAPLALFMTVVDANNNNAEIAGVLSGLSYTSADPAQDVAVVDPTNPLDVDVHAVTNTGGTTVTGTGTFVSTLTNPDGTPAFSGTVTGQLVLVNNIPVAVLNPVLAFNQ